MKKIISAAPIILLLICPAISFSQDEMVKELRKVSSFSAIDASGIAHVYLTKGTEEKVEVSVNYPEIKDHLKITVSDDVLHIKFEDLNGKRREYNNLKVQVYITYKQLKGLDGSGATIFESKNEISADKFSLRISGANNTVLSLNVKSLHAEVSGAAKANLSGAAGNLHLEASGASNINAFDLQAQDVKAETSGVAKVNVAAQKTIDINASGLSNISYQGDAQVIAQEVSKMAKAHKR